MNKFFYLLDKYKIGILAAFLTYVLIFMYLQLRSYSAPYVPYEAFPETSHIEIPDEEMELKPENILIPADYQADVKNVTRDANDKRERSTKDYSQNMASGSDVVQSVYELEQQLMRETGGAEARASIQKQIDERKKKELAEAKSKDKNKPANVGGDKVFGGNVMVEWVLTERSPLQKNNWNVRNPGYTCGKGSAGLVTMIIKVSQSGDVISATYDPNQSRGANACMIEQAQKYALMSRFDYSSGAPKTQEGRISYTFVSQ